jgi:hypothetical protein
LTCGSSAADWSIKACAVSGTRRVQRRDFQARLGNDGVRQIIGRRHLVNSGKLLFQQFQPVVQILIAISGNCQRQFVGQLQGGEFFDRHQVLVEVLELT